MHGHSVIVLVLCLRVIDCDVSERLDLPELESIHLGEYAFYFDCSDSTTIIMRSTEEENGMID